MFEKIMNYIKEFLEDTPKDIYEFSIILEDAFLSGRAENQKTCGGKSPRRVLRNRFTQKSCQERPAGQPRPRP